jgi:DNA-binding NarL/FixJ family response regulator
VTGVFGREKELAQAQAFLESEAAQPRLLLFEGEPGIGKTTLLQASVERARELGLRVLESRPAEAERELSYAGLADLLAKTHDDIGRLPGPQRRALRIALLLDEPTGEAPDARAIAAGLLGLLRQLADETATVVAIDDFQWLDPASHAALRFALRRLNDEPVRVVAATRGSGRDFENAARIVVRPLAPRALDELVRSRLGVQLLRPILRQLEEVSGGNPFYVLELGTALIRSGACLEPGAPLPVPPSLQDVVRIRLDELSPSGREAALAAAALPKPTRVLIADVLGSDAGVREAVAAHVLEADGEDVRFTHPLLGTILHDDASLEEKRSLHRRLVEVVDEPEQRALLLATVAGGPDDELASALEAAAEHATARGAAESGAALARRALDLTPVTRLEDAHRRRLLWARFTAAAGDPKRAEGLLEQQLEDVEAGRGRAEILFELGNVRLRMRGNTPAQHCYERALEELGGASEHNELRLLILLELGIAQAGEFGNDSDVPDPAIALAEEIGNPDLLARAFGLHAMRLTLRFEQVNNAYWQRALEVEKESGALRFGGPSHAYALYVFVRNDFDAGAQYLEPLVESMRARGDPKLASVLQDLTDIARASGAWDVGSQLADEAYEYVVQTGQESMEPQCLLYKARFALLRGDLEPAREHTTRAVALSEHLESAEGSLSGALAPWDSLLLDALARFLLGRIAAASGRHDEAHKWFSSDLEILRNLATGVVPARSWLAEVLAEDIASLLALGDIGSAIAELDELRTLAAECPLVVAALAARSQGLVAAAQRRNAEARDHLERSLALLDGEESPWPFETGQNLLALGTVLRSERQKLVARMTLERALEIFERLGARLWAEKARAELARLGGRPSRPGALTATEQRVADLVAAGRSNAEVARELFLSPKTVEWNLSKIYKKLHVRSRTELAAKLAKRQLLSR